MSLRNQKWVAALIAAHPDQRIFGRTRLQKEVKLLQRLDFPTDYSYSIHFYGPYSESLQSDIGLMEVYGLISESCEQGRDGNEYYVLEATESADLPDVSEFEGFIAQLCNAPTVVLELAATYDAFRERGDDHEEALERLRRKKGAKCENGNEDAALELLSDLGLEAE